VSLVAAGAYGFCRSHDEGAAWLRINDDQHQYGDIRSISGDPRVSGATGTRGIVYGDIARDEGQVGPQAAAVILQAGPSELERHLETYRDYGPLGLFRKVR